MSLLLRALARDFVTGFAMAGACHGIEPIWLAQEFARERLSEPLEGSAVGERTSRYLKSRTTSEDQPDDVTSPAYEDLVQRLGTCRRLLSARS